jgi:hypothetical protein
MEPVSQGMAAGLRRAPLAPHAASGVVAATVAVALGLIGSGVIVWRGTEAAFTSQTSNAGNSWTAGSVVLADDDTGAALFNAGGLFPGAAGSRCITVTYTGSLATNVRLYVAASTDPSAVAQYLDLIIQEGTGGGFGSCAGFSASASIYTGTLAAFASAASGYSTGVGAWAPGSAGSRTFQIAYSLSAATPTSKQGAAATATFQWESQA